MTRRDVRAAITQNAVHELGKERSREWGDEVGGVGGWAGGGVGKYNKPNRLRGQKQLRSDLGTYLLLVLLIN